MEIIRTENLTAEQMKADPRQEWIYCGLDSLVTAELHPVIVSYFRNTTAATYSFAMDLLAPLIEMMLRGTLVDPEKRRLLTMIYDDRRRRLEWILNQYADVIWGKPLNANSPAQLKVFFYEKMNLPVQTISYKGEKKVSTGREALEKLEEYFYAQPIIAVILALRDANKKLSVLRGRKKVSDAILDGDNVIDGDGRFRTSFNIGKETGRLSSSGSVWGRGSNSQNITEELRRIFIADPGRKLAYLDLSSAESMAVGYLAEDENYIKACITGDPHTYVASLCWPHLGWTGDVKADREPIAEQSYYRQFSYRDMAKRGGHASNYYAKPFTISRHLKIPVPVAREFQGLYFGAFPGITRWHQRVVSTLQTEGALTTAMGFERHFAGRRTDEATWREAIAFEPQSLVAFILNTGLLNIWRQYRKHVNLLFQIHDAILFDYDPQEESDIIPACIQALKIPVEVRNRTMTISADAAVGWNWSKADPDRRFHEDKNPNGLMKWKGTPDARTRQKETDGIMEYLVRPMAGPGPGPVPVP